MLQADPSAAVQELLVVLIVVVPLVLIPNQNISDLGIAAAGGFHLAHVVEATHPACDVPGRQWLSLQGLDDADDINDPTSLLRSFVETGLFGAALVDPDGLDHP